MVAIWRTRSRNRLFHWQSGFGMYYHRHSNCLTDIQDWLALPMPFGSTVVDTDSPIGCIRIPLNLLWLIFGGLWAWCMHILFGLLLCITIIGIPWGKQHFKMAGLSLAPFGKDVMFGF